jgi:hypothetical protein
VAAVTTKVERIYDRYTYLPENRAALQKWEIHLSNLLAS